MSEDKKRFLVSLKPSYVRQGSGCEGEREEERRRRLGERLEGFLAERQALMASSRTLSPGTVISGKVSLRCALSAQFSKSKNVLGSLEVSQKRHFLDFCG